MNSIELAIALGKAIQKDDRYIAYHLAKQANDEDNQLQALINGFQMNRMELQMEIGKPDKDNDKVQTLNDSIKDSYQKIMENPKMLVYQSTKTAMDELLSQINTIITMSANGVNPEEIDYTTASCAGDCGSCGGCG